MLFNISFCKIIVILLIIFVILYRFYCFKSIEEFRIIYLTGDGEIYFIQRYTNEICS